MKCDYAYGSDSVVESSADATRMGFAPNTLREPTFFSGQLRQSLTSRVVLADQHGQARIVPRSVVVVEIFVAQRQCINPSGDQIVDRMLDQPWASIIGKAVGESPDDFQFRIGFPRQQRPGIRRHSRSIETSANFPPNKRLKIEPIRVTLCSHRVASYMRCNL